MVRLCAEAAADTSGDTSFAAEASGVASEGRAADVRARVLVAMFAGMGLALVIWVRSSGFWPLVVFAFIFGTAYGGR
jgi:hypothetical protein